MLYSVGDVVKAIYSWVDKDGTTKAVLRPVIIKEIKATKYLVVKISRSNKVEGLIRVVKDSREWNAMGLYDTKYDSFVDRLATLEIEETEIERKLGNCPPEIFCML